MNNLKMISEPIDINNDLNKMLQIFKDLVDSAYVPNGSSKKDTRNLKEFKDTTNKFVEKINLLTVIEQLKLLGVNTNTCSKLRQSLSSYINKFSKMSKLLMESAVKTTSFISNKNTITEEYAEPFLINSDASEIVSSDKIYYYYFTNREEFKSKEKCGFSLQKQLFETLIVDRLIMGFTIFSETKRNFFEQIDKKEQEKINNSNLESIEELYNLNKFALDAETLKKVDKDRVSLKFKYIELSKLEYAKELLVMLPIMTFLSSNERKLYNKIIIEVDQKMASVLNSISSLEANLKSMLDLKEIIAPNDDAFTNVDIEKDYIPEPNVNANEYKKDEVQPVQYPDTILLSPDYIGLKEILHSKYEESSSNMSFLNFLKSNYPQYKILISYEEVIEARNSEVCEAYIEYYSHLEDRSDAMSIYDFAKYVYDINAFEIPFDYQERINNLTVKNK